MMRICHQYFTLLRRAPRPDGAVPPAPRALAEDAHHAVAYVGVAAARRATFRRKSVFHRCYRFLWYSNASSKIRRQSPHDHQTQKCISPRAVKFLQRTGALQIIYQRIDELFRLCADSSIPLYHRRNHPPRNAEEAGGWNRRPACIYAKSNWIPEQFVTIRLCPVSSFS